ncbi:MAG: hypothetical protein ACREPF_00400 [Rhodanobacteraceae bacterium]
MLERAAAADHNVARSSALQRRASILAGEGDHATAPRRSCTLLKANRKPPRDYEWGIRVGGDEEAWLYRCDTLVLWQRLRAMDWLRACAKELRRIQRRQR